MLCGIQVEIIYLIMGRLTVKFQNWELHIAKGRLHGILIHPAGDWHRRQLLPGKSSRRFKIVPKK